MSLDDKNEYDPNENLNIGEPRTPEHLELNISKKKQTIIAVIAVSLIILTVGLTLYNNQTEAELQEIIDDPTSMTVEEFENSDTIQFKISDLPPYALDNRNYDFVADHMTHEKPTIVEFQNTLLWASTNDKNALLEIEKEIIAGAKDNQNYMSPAEKSMLEVIYFTVYPEQCDQIELQNQCAFYDINLQQARYQSGEIDRDQYWLNVKQYASPEVIAEVEKTIEG